MSLQWLGSRVGVLVSSCFCFILTRNTAKVWRVEGHALFDNGLFPHDRAFYFSVVMCFVFLGLYGAAMSIRLLLLGFSKYLSILALIVYIAQFAAWIPIAIPVAAAYGMAAVSVVLEIYVMLKK
jgi:hypothetical protein